MANVTDSFSFKAKITSQIGNNERFILSLLKDVDVEILVPLKYLSNFCRTLQMPLINCEVNLILISSENCLIVYTDASN